MAKPKKAEQATTVVYCGPSIPGVAKQYTAYTNGIPTALAEGEDSGVTPEDPAAPTAWWCPWSSYRRP